MTTAYTTDQSYTDALPGMPEPAPTLTTVTVPLRFRDWFSQRLVWDSKNDYEKRWDMSDPVHSLVEKIKNAQDRGGQPLRIRITAAEANELEMWAVSMEGETSHRRFANDPTTAHRQRLAARAAQRQAQAAGSTAYTREVTA